MLIVLGCIVVCLFPKPTIQQECDKCFCPSSKPIPRESAILNGKEGKNATLDLMEIKHWSKPKIERESKHLKRNVEEKLEDLGLNLREKNAVISIFDHAYNKLSNNKISSTNTWKTVYNVLEPVIDRIAFAVFRTYKTCSFDDIIRCAFALGDKLLGCTLITLSDNNLSRMVKCAFLNAYEARCTKKCVCSVATFFLQDVEAIKIGRLPACPQYVIEYRISD